MATQYKSRPNTVQEGMFTHNGIYTDERCHIRGPIVWVNVFVAIPENRNKTDAEFMDLVAETIHARISKKTQDRKSVV